jgi:hypothetical protein
LGTPYDAGCSAEEIGSMNLFDGQLKSHQSLCHEIVAAQPGTGDSQR